MFFPLAGHSATVDNTEPTEFREFSRQSVSDLWDALQERRSPSQNWQFLPRNDFRQLFPNSTLLSDVLGAPGSRIARFFDRPVGLQFRRVVDAGRRYIRERLGQGGDNTDDEPVLQVSLYASLIWMVTSFAILFVAVRPRGILRLASVQPHK